MKIIRILSAVLLGLIVINLLSSVLLPSDILNTFPHFSLNAWERPHNSLLADPLFQFEPWRHFTKEKLLNMQLPLWNDLNGAGAPFLATPHTQIFSPFNVLYYLFPVTYSLLFIHGIKIILFFLFSYVYLRQLAIQKGSAVIGATFALSGFMMLWLQWPQTSVYLIFPLLLYCTEKITDANKTILAFSALYFIGFLGGHPETLFLMFVVHMLYTLLRKRKVIPYLLISVIVAGLMASFLILPFLEYLINSALLMHRAQTASYHLIPLFGLISNAYPFVLGAPHLLYYHALQNTNFQEMSGGFVGIIAILLSFLAIKIKGIKNVAGAWFVVIIFSFIFSYDLPLVSPLIQHSFLNLSANHRLIAFFGFGFSVLAAFGLDELQKTKKSFLTPIVVAISGVLLVGMLLVYAVPENYAYSKYTEFLKYTVPYIFIGVVTTLLFFTKKLRKNYFILTVLVILQTFFFLSTYNTFTKATQYYPETKFTKYLASKKDVRLLEVGNPNIPPNINLIYKFGMAENNDALGVSSYQTAFDTAFPVKNRWGKVDQVNLSSLQEFGITHIISDFDINLKKINIQKTQSNRIVLTKNITVELPEASGVLSQVRFIAYNFNRLNACTIDIVLTSEHQVLSRSQLDCRDARDGMFYSTSVSDVLLSPNKKYQLEFIPRNTSNTNYISLAGSAKSPYLDLLFKKQPVFNPVMHEKSVYLFEVPNVHQVQFAGTYTMLQHSSEKSTYKLNSNGTSIHIRKAYYPGWSAYIDGSKVPLHKDGAFMKIYIPQGEHVLIVKYFPLSLSLGLVVSTIAVILYIVFCVRVCINTHAWKNLRLQILKKAKQLRLIIEPAEYLMTFLLASAGALVTYFALTYGNPFVFAPQALAINWLTVHGYSKVNDVVNVFLFIGSFLFWGAVCWGVLVWKKLKK